MAKDSTYWDVLMAENREVLKAERLHCLSIIQITNSLLAAQTEHAKHADKMRSLDGRTIAARELAEKMKVSRERLSSLYKQLKKVVN